ncbi:MULTISPECIES: DNA-directed RNA polymerase subunit omega [Pelosinus]|jgi:DNA-directed RNA polymerase subunit omega|uniref:DNA-directed RNA polymerase subunit omega n=2 Tax=Pelosinus TaxID=365348 RepID=I8RJ00_9FIRM|nr:MULTISPECIES: DNA-directed RNA polymerase subunit omega [Pelosinus]MBP2659038.1 DNA-directed polymerase subunit omega [Bacillota bacterium]EIW18105.1 DNA-directed RNA polymerase, omega subunit [Pelosinus fermentans B4]EIW24143.1 DNA-directed RNA polymerase subunit omega [Pelosinus fermentans A11]MCC5465053.1 DNA-directed RNA polymerase subunit omega [Pelosinus baikalensis]OAM94162.1 DNA-directed RNA polymerase subunit omega [Pelosinus fermentans DSM 17108]
MIYPSLDVLVTKVDSKYTLVVLAAKRAREIMDGATSLVESKSNKQVTIALEEVAQDKISYERTKSGIK